jgi:hypothetical protein
MSKTAILGVVCLVLIALQGGCSHPRYYADAEYSLATHGNFPSQGHFAVYYPSEIALDFPGYLVGIEMSDRDRLLSKGDLVVESVVHAGSTMARLTDILRDGIRRIEPPGEGTDLLPFISHVIRYRGRTLGAGNCALYNLYQSSMPELMDFCDGRRRPAIENWGGYRSAFADSWRAIDVLKDAVHRDAATGNYTHLIIAMMGWRTTQEEAVRNFNSLVRSIKAVGKEEFRPLFVGITWVGPWAGRWLDPLVEAFAYGNIAELADTVGLTWLGVLTDEIVMPLSGKLPTIFITHSFGTRAASTAVCIGPAIRRDAAVAQTSAKGAVDRLIGFEAAFSLQRFKKERVIFFYEDVYFPNDCGRAKSIVLTTTKYDLATKSILWADLAGNYRYFKSFCRANSGTLVSCTSVDEAGVIESDYDPSMKVLYLDATKLIRFRAPGTDGGAHSDIFRPPTGRLLWDLISKPPHVAGNDLLRQ